MAGIGKGESHEHTFRNPGGFSFHVLCFDRAPGCQAIGGYTLEASWFSGYEWCLALCSGCQTHLGWFFRKPDHDFVGLVATRLS